MGAVRATAALAWVQKLPEGQAHENAFANVSSQWARSDPRAAASYLQGMPPGKSP